MLTLSLAEAGAAALAGNGEVVTEGGGLEPGRWYGVEVVNDEEGGNWRVFPLDDLTGTGVEAPVEWPPIASVGEVCLGAEGPPNAAVNYDNLTITNE